MPRPKAQTLSGWGHVPVAQCLAWRPEKRRELAYLLQSPGAKIARGMGRAYGDCALQPEGVVLTERLNHFIEFDARRGIVRAQGGVTMAELMEQCVPSGWMPAAIPGTRHVTLGGAFACNVHGKNQFRDGDFAESVHSIKLVLPGGETLDCSPTHNREIFWATAGGMGMTGIVEELTLKLKPITSASLSATTWRVESLQEMLDAFAELRGESDYMVGWIDHMAKGDALGRGIFQAASHSESGAPLIGYIAADARFSVPFFLPPAALNRYSMALYNMARFRKYSAWRKTETVGFNSFFHPLDRIDHWNRLYGRRGFFQYQCLFPDAPDIAERIHTFLSALHHKNIFSFLAVLKSHRRGKGLLTFSQSGYSLALDFPNTPQVRAVLPQLDKWVADHGGRIYLAKDACLSADLFRVMYGKAAQDWLSVINQIDPDAKFTSLMSQRLEWKSQN